jgi:hypothetical protein
MVDLNALVPADSSLQLAQALNINDRGEILGLGVPPGAPTDDFRSISLDMFSCYFRVTGMRTRAVGTRTEARKVREGRCIRFEFQRTGNSSLSTFRSMGRK